MAQPKSPNSPYGNRPSSLADPVPTDNMEALANEILGESVPKQQDMAATAGQAAEGAVDSMESLANEMLGQPVEQAPQQPQPQESNFIESIGRGVQNTQILGENLMLRMQTAMAANDVEATNYLKKKFGDENVKYTNGKLRFRKPGEKEFKDLDPEAFEIVGDVFVDNLRGFMEEAMLLPSEVVGGVVGAAGGTPLSVAGGAAIGRAASYPAVRSVSDSVAEWVGIPQDESRNKTTENAIGAALEATGPVFGKVVRGMARFMPKTRQAAKRAAEKGAVYSMALDKDSQLLKESVEELEQEYMGQLRINGEAIGYPDADVTLMPYQLNPQHPIAKAHAQTLKNDTTFLQAQNQIAENTMNVVKQTAAKVADETKSIPREKIGEAVINAAEGVRKAEGQIIGKFKKQARQNLKNAPIPVDQELLDTFQSLSQNLGGMDAKNIPLGTMGLTKKSQVVSVVNTLKAIQEDALKNGGTALRLDQIEKHLNNVADLNRLADKVGSGFNAQWKALSKQMRQYRRNAISSGLDEGQSKLFNESMDKYSQLIGTIENVEKLVSTDMGAHVVVKQMLGKGREALGDAKNLKTMLKDNPEAWNSLKGHWMDQILHDHKFGTTLDKANPMGLVQKLEATYGDEFMNVLFDSPKDYKQFKNALRLAARVRETKVKPGASDEFFTNLTQKTEDAQQFGRWFRVSSLFKLFGLDNKNKAGALREMLESDNLEKYITQLPANKRPEAYEMFRGLYNFGVATGHLKKKVRTLRDVPTRPLPEIRNRGASVIMKEQLKSMGRANQPLDSSYDSTLAEILGQ